VELYDAIEEYLRENRHGVLGTIVKRVGATPQGTGAKIFVGEDNRLFGTIGGGCVEAEVSREARWLMGGSETKVIHYPMTGTEVADEGMICGGSADIFLEPVSPCHGDLYSSIRACMESGERALLVTGIGTGRFFKGLLSEDGRLWGDGPDAASLETLRGHFNDRRPAIEGDLLIEAINPKPRLFVYGAGHISQFIARIAGMTDFGTTVIDDRMSCANRERFPEADRVLAGYFDEVLDTLDPTPEDYHVIVTRGHRNDAEVLEWILRRPSAYVGMIGSKRKTRMVYDHLAARGVDPELFKGVHAPIGLDIDAETPQEIAVSIVAELIKVRATRSSRTR
jgi:xanthine dehydrogenase accessory factor